MWALLDRRVTVPVDYVWFPLWSLVRPGCGGGERGSKRFEECGDFGTCVCVGSHRSPIFSTPSSPSNSRRTVCSLIPHRVATSGTE
jgi:hypothetical protein